MNNKSLKGAILVIVSAILFGTMPLFTKTAYSHGSNAISVAFGRFLFGSLFLALLCKETKKRLNISKKMFLELLKISFVYASVPVLLYLSYNYVDSGLATTLHFAYPIAVVLLARILFHQVFEKKQLFCVLLCSLGILCLYKVGGSFNILGMIIALVSGVLYALYILLFEKADFSSIPALVISFWLSLLACIEIGITAIVSGQMVVHMDILAWTMEILLAMITMIFATPFFQIGVKDCGGLMASLLSTFEPVTSLFVGILFFSEVLTSKDVLGIFLILTSTMILVLKKTS